MTQCYWLPALGSNQEPPHSKCGATASCASGQYARNPTTGATRVPRQGSRTPFPASAPYTAHRCPLNAKGTESNRDDAVGASPGACFSNSRYSRFVWLRGFEPPTPCSPSRCATKLRHSQMCCDTTYHNESSPSRDRTWNLAVNSRALLPVELMGNVWWSAVRVAVHTSLRTPFKHSSCIPPSTLRGAAGNRTRDKIRLSSAARALDPHPASRVWGLRT